MPAKQRKMVAVQGVVAITKNSLCPLKLLCVAFNLVRLDPWALLQFRGRKRRVALAGNVHHVM